jgi:hypothetical protein
MKINKAQIKRSQCANQKVELGKIDDAAAVIFLLWHTLSLAVYTLKTASSYR